MYLGVDPGVVGLIVVHGLHCADLDNIADLGQRWSLLGMKSITVLVPLVIS